jgi:hypothetical protein
MQKFDTSTLITALTQTLDRNSQTQLLKSLTDSSIKDQTQMSQKMLDQITDLYKKLEEIQKENKVLSENEIKLVEAAISDVLTSLESKGLFSLVVTVDGKNYAIKDIATALANLPGVTDTDFTYNEDRTQLIAVKYTLDNGTESVLQGTMTETDTQKSYVYAGMYDGVPCSVTAVYDKHTLVVGSVSGVNEILRHVSNPTFAITRGLREVTAFTANDIAPDLNKDGTVESTAVKTAGGDGTVI